MTGGKPLLFDTHCHLTDPKLAGDESDCIEMAKRAGVAWILTVGIDLATSREAARQSGAYEGVFAAVGIHPHEASAAGESDLEELESLLEKNGVVAIGEVGLDYRYEISSRERQKELFARQVELARRRRVPLVVHSREAVGDCIEILSEHGGGEVGGVFHCFTGTAEEAAEAVGLGFHVSFAGNVTYRGFDARSAAVVPPGRLLIETDSPYLAPVPHRGKVNEPAFLPFVLEGLAGKIEREDVRSLARITTANAARLFLEGPGLSGKVLDLLDQGVD